MSDAATGLIEVEAGLQWPELIRATLAMQDALTGFPLTASARMMEVVLLTGHASVDSGIEGMKLGAFDYLMKPIELEPLLEKLGDAYEKKRLHQDKIEQAQMKRHLSMPS